jgi:hypothetical protein
MQLILSPNEACSRGQFITGKGTIADLNFVSCSKDWKLISLETVRQSRISFGMYSGGRVKLSGVLKCERRKAWLEES